MESCLLCLEFDKRSIKACSKKWQEFNIQQILEKHFWSLNSINNSSAICLNCWEEVDDFHKFYERIEKIHKNSSKINNFEFFFQEPEILLQEAEPVDIVDDKELSLKEPFNLVPEIKQESECLQGKNDIESEDPLKKCKHLVTSKSPGTRAARRTRSRRSELNDKNEESVIKKEALDIDENIKHDNCDGDNYHGDNRHAAVLFEPESREKIGTSEKRGSSETQRLKRQDNDKFIAEHFKEIPCDLCQAPFKDFPSLQKHFARNHKQRGYIVCCKRKFHSRTSLIDHLLCHINPDYYKCKECGKSMSERMSFKNHMLRVHRANEVVKKHSCDICGKAFIKAYVLRNHMLTHLPEKDKKFPCKECGKNYASAYLLSQHQQAVHLKRFAKICDFCGKSFNSNVELKAHINKHEGIPAPVLTCDVCGLRLTTAKGLKLHKMNQHPVGGKQDHPCPVCAKISPNPTALRKHIYRMHGKGYDYKCSICEKSFKRSEVLKEHMAAHTGNALYKCQWCPMTFNSNGNMYAHRKKMHPQEWTEMQLKKYATNIPEEISNL